MTKPVAILGCGPAGLMAAHAVATRGHDIAIFSQPTKSTIGGAQFLHEPIPAVCDDDPDAVVAYRVQGDAITYRQKVYGLNPMQTPDFVSFENVYDGMEQPAWNLQKVYDKLWSVYGLGINPIQVTPKWLEHSLKEFRMVISTIPLPALCRSRNGDLPVVHRFDVQQVLVSNRAVASLPDNTIFYNGEKAPSWYRMSNLFGHGSTEWSTLTARPPLPDLKQFAKPLRAVCDCWPDVVRAGRFGTWRKGVLTHDAYTTAIKAMEDRL